MPDQQAGRTAASPVQDYLQELLERFRKLKSGEVAAYIPELAKANPDWFSICVATVDGKTYEVGDSRQTFSIQSVSKPLAFALALEEKGWRAVLKRVGVEPSGEAFNAIVLDQASNRPYNPMVNSGALATTAIISADRPEQRVKRILDFIGQLANRELAIDEAVYESERETGHRNRAIAHLMRNFHMLEGDVEPVLDAYFRQCSILVTCRDLSMIGATMANGGVNPESGRRVISPFNVRCVLSVMGTCGMYDFAGEWAYEVGMPAKSGVSGGILAVLPGQLAIGVFSPPVDARGNSVRGIETCRAICDRFGLHQYDTAPSVRSVVRREYRGDAVSSRRQRTMAQRELLEREGKKVLIIELQGHMFFGAAERLLRHVESKLAGLTHVVIDFGRITGIERNTVSILIFLWQAVTGAGVTLYVSSADREGEVSEILKSMLLSADGVMEAAEPMFFADILSALEQVEQDLLAKAPSVVAEPAHMDLKGLDLFQGFGAEELQALGQALLPLRFPAGAKVLSEGEAATAFYVLASGSVSVKRRLPSGGREVQLAKVGPGVVFGEMALLDQGRRTADIHAEEDILCYALPMDRLDKLCEAFPDLRAQLFHNIARELAAKLRRANDEITALFT